MNFGDYDLPEDTDATTSAELLKHWLRGLKNPLFPVGIYSNCIAIGKTFLEGRSVLTSQLRQACKKLCSDIPPVNLMMLERLSGFFKLATSAEFCDQTNMTMNTFSIVVGPNCLRSPSDNLLELAKNIHFQNSFFQCFMAYLMESGLSFDYSSFLPQ
jgi:nitrate reductase gamma subunit